MSIKINDKLIKRLGKYGLQHYPKEYGGLLIGRYENEKETAVIEGTLLPKRFKSSAYSFERNVSDLRKSLKKFFDKCPSQVYVGEWHSHPEGPASPSSTDMKALREIAAHDEVFIENPILIIISIRKKTCEPGFFVLYKNKIYRYEKEEGPHNSHHNHF